jgi:rare lipoprotein A
MKKFLAGLMILGLAACSSIPTPAPVAERQASATVPQADATERATPKSGGGYYKDDGPGANPPPDLDAIPDAVPRVEPLHRFANRPYTVLGQSHTPATELRPWREAGVASWYGRRYHGQRTSSGEPYDMYGMSAAHRTLPIPSYVRVTNPANQRSVVVRVNDRGPFHSDRVIDLSYTAAYKLGILQGGSGKVEVESIDPRASQAAAPPPVKPQPPAASPSPAPQTALVAAADGGGIYVQLGAFGMAENAEQFRDRLKLELPLALTHLAGKLQVVSVDGLFKVRAGPYSDQAQASQSAAEIRKALNINTMVIFR